jgi:hypothetical protein
MQQTITVPPAPPAPPGTPAPGMRVYVGDVNSPAAVYEAAMAQRDELKEQLEGLRHERNQITEELSNGETRGADRSGLEARLVTMDARIAAVDKQVAAADEKVATASAIPTAVTGHQQLEQARMANMRDHNGPPEEAFVVGALFIVVAILPISIAFARRIWRRGAAAVSALPGDLMDRLSHLDQAMESIAIEVERIGEGQRFVTRLMSDNAGRAVGPGPAEPVRQAVRDAVPVRSGESPR